ncbi:MAG: hypothetical protein Q9218_001923 [Villophora microphyllina]
MFNCSHNTYCCDDLSSLDGACCDIPKSLLSLGARQVAATVGAVAAFPENTVSATPTYLSVFSIATSKPSLSANAVTSTHQTSSSMRTAQPSALDNNNTTGSNAAPIQSTGSNSGAKIGVGVGIPLGLALIAAILYILFLQFRHKRHRETQAEGTLRTGNGYGREAYQQEITHTNGDRLNGQREPQMMESDGNGRTRVYAKAELEDENRRMEVGELGESDERAELR